MKSSNFYYQSADDTFRQFVIVSVVLHFSFVLITIVKSFLLPSTMMVIPNAVRVDMIALPDKLPEDVKVTPQEKPKEKPAPVIKKEVAKDNKETQKKALEKLKALDAIEKMKNEISQQEAAKDIAPPAPPAPQFKGNIISSGNSYTGLSRLRVNDYLENMITKIRDHWVLPQWLNNPNLKAAIVIEVDARGYIVRKEVHTSSGNSVFDSSCLAAVSEASPFPDPPDEVKGVLLMIRFPLG